MLSHLGGGQCNSFSFSEIEAGIKLMHLKKRGIEEAVFHSLG